MRILNPKYLLVLIWSFRSEIIKQELNYLKKGGNLIFIRHSYAPGGGDPDNFDLNDCV